MGGDKLNHRSFLFTDCMFFELMRNQEQGILHKRVARITSDHTSCINKRRETVAHSETEHKFRNNCHILIQKSHTYFLFSRV